STGRALLPNRLQSGPGLLPCTLSQVMLIESLPDECLYDGLTAYVKILSGPVQFLQHGRGEIHVDALDRVNHSALALEETRDVLPLIGQPCDRVGGNGFSGLTSSLHI